MSSGLGLHCADRALQRRSCLRAVRWTCALQLRRLRSRDQDLRRVFRQQPLHVGRLRHGGPALRRMPQQRGLHLGRLQHCEPDVCRVSEQCAVSFRRMRHGQASVRGVPRQHALPDRCVQHADADVRAVRRQRRLLDRRMRHEHAHVRQLQITTASARAARATRTRTRASSARRTHSAALTSAVRTTPVLRALRMRNARAACAMRRAATVFLSSPSSRGFFPPSAHRRQAVWLSSWRGSRLCPLMTPRCATAGSSRRATVLIFASSDIDVSAWPQVPTCG